MEKELVKTDPDQGTPLTMRNLFIHHDAHPIVLDFALVKQYGREWLNWEPETIYSEIAKDFNCQISEHARSKIQAVKTLHCTDLAWKSWNVFEKVAQALNNNIPRFDLMQPLSLEQVYGAVDIMEGLENEEFSEEVQRYMAACIMNEEVTFAPPPLPSDVQLFISNPKYFCKDCGHEYAAVHHDGICDHCSGKFDAEMGLSMRPNPERPGKGTNTELILTLNPDEVQARWESVRTSPSSSVDLGENQVDIQVAKLLVARDYMNVRRKQLTEQLIALKSWLGAS
jgi:hypothetical protein